LTLRALTLDLDDTLWPVWPAITRAEENLHRWLQQHAPRTAARYDLDAMRALRARVAHDNPHLAHDYGAQRRLSLSAALRECDEDPNHVDTAYEIFIAGRNQVDLYPDVELALARLTTRFPIAALTNGNADLKRIGLHSHFVFQLGAREHGRAKPCATIFHAACARLGVEPHQVLHIGDDPDLDVRGAQQAGMKAAWINRNAAAWSHPQPPDVTATCLSELADWIDQHHPAVPAPPASNCKTA
jgi:putative hydrolase of the HAD superfamily